MKKYMLAIYFYIFLATANAAGPTFDTVTIENVTPSTALSVDANKKVISLGYTPENAANKATDLSTNDNTHYPTTEAVKSAITASTTPPGGSTNSLQFNNGSGGFGGGTVSTDGNNLSIDNTFGLRLNGASDANWQIGRSLSTFVSPWLSPLISTSTLDVVFGNGGGEGLVIGTNDGNQIMNIDSSWDVYFAHNIISLNDIMVGSSPVTTLFGDGHVESANNNLNWDTQGNITTNGGIAAGAGSASTVVLRLFGAVSQTANYLNITANGGSAGGVFNIDSSGNVIIGGLTASTVPYINSSKALQSSSVTPTELSYLSGVTSSIQTQLNDIAPGGNDNDIQTKVSGALHGDDNFQYNGSQATFNLVDSYGGLHILGRSGGEASFAIQPDNVSNGSAGQWILYTNGSNLNNQNDFAFYSSELSSSVFVLQSATGNLGVGMNNPTYKVDVNGGMHASGNLQVDDFETIGINGSATGLLSLANGNGGGAVITLQNVGTTAAYNWFFPTGPGSAGQVLLSGGSASVQTWGNESDINDPSTVTTVDYSVALDDSFVAGNSATAINITLPDPTSFPNRKLNFININTGAMNMIGTISGVVNPPIDRQYDSISIKSIGGAWLLW